MIHPNMATMLAFMTTDAPVEAGFLQRCLSESVERSFNLVSIDGDTSPSDTAIVLANGAAGGPPITAGDSRAEGFAEALDALCIHLAREIARDAEGATRIMEIAVTGAASEEEARHVVRLISTSYLVKSAVHGADPNWGRIVTVLGRSGVTFDESQVTVQLCGNTIFANGAPADFDAVGVSYAMQGDTVPIAVDLGAGLASATGWGCDLSPEYVHINADYTT
jgi:glutamate N-acetyltransferase/amino-acid N-acetyltransferase